MDTRVDNKIGKFLAPLRQAPSFDTGVLGSARRAGEEINREVGKPLVSGFEQAQKKTYGGVMKGMEAISPSTYIEPQLTKLGVPSSLVFGIGLTADLLTPFPGDDMARIKKFIEPLSEAQKGMKAFEGFTDLSTKTLEKLKGRTTVSKQFISDLTNSPDLKQAERDIIRKTLEGMPETIPVDEFANKVKTELLPLKMNDANTQIDEYTSRRGTHYGRQYEGITLPKEIRGNVANYNERIYESPIQTSAGSVHFSDITAPNYFAHTRIEDLAVSPGEAQKVITDTLAGREIQFKGGGTRRVIEIQSDLFQKGRLERETKITPDLPKRGTKDLETYVSDVRKQNEARQNELSKLEPYRNTWHERIIREEVKQAAVDGKTKLQFPTGETAMEIEGLGAQQGIWTIKPNTRTFTTRMGDQVPTFPSTFDALKTENAKVGQEIYRDGFQRDAWIITDVLGDGKFKAVPKDQIDRLGGIDKAISLERMHTEGRALARELNSETFDISGKVDTENPIYKFYEKEVGKYLKNKYNAQLITDPQGVKWWQMDVKPEMKNKPIEAFGKIQTGALIGGGIASAAAVIGSMKNTEIYTRPLEDKKEIINSLFLK